MFLSVLISLLLSCSPDPVATSPEETLGEFDVEVEASEVISSVLTVRWTTPEAGDGVVDFGEELRYTAEGRLGEDDVWEATLVGFPANRDAQFRVRHGDVVDEVRTHTLEPAPSWVPLDPEVVGEGTQGFLVSGYRSEEGRGALIVDSLGRPVWWYDALGWGEDTYVSRATLSPSGDAVWFNTIRLRTAPDDADAERGVVRVSLDGSEVEHIPLEEHHHDFWLHEDGTIVYLAVAPAEVDGVAVDLDSVMKRAPDGTIETFYVTEDIVTPTTLQPWVNTIEYDEANGRYWVGAKSLASIIRLDAETGERIDLIGGPKSDWDVDQAFVDQHGFDLLDDGRLLLFDNGDIAEMDSRPTRYLLDEETKTAELEWEYSADPPLYTNFLGDALDLGNGRVLSIWTFESVVMELDEQGEMASRWEYKDLEMLTFGRWYESVSP